MVSPVVEVLRQTLELAAEPFSQRASRHRDLAEPVGHGQQSVPEAVHRAGTGLAQRIQRVLPHRGGELLDRLVHELPGAGSTAFQQRADCWNQALDLIHVLHELAEERLGHALLDLAPLVGQFHQILGELPRSRGHFLEGFREGLRAFLLLLRLIQLHRIGDFTNGHLRAKRRLRNGQNPTRGCRQQRPQLCQRLNRHSHRPSQGVHTTHQSARGVHEQRGHPQAPEYRGQVSDPLTQLAQRRTGVFCAPVQVTQLGRHPMQRTAAVIRTTSHMKDRLRHAGEHIGIPVSLLADLLLLLAERHHVGGQVLQRGTQAEHLLDVGISGL